MSEHTYIEYGIFNKLPNGKSLADCPISHSWYFDSPIRTINGSELYTKEVANELNVARDKARIYGPLLIDEIFNSPIQIVIRRRKVVVTDFEDY